MSETQCDCANMNGYMCYPCLEKDYYAISADNFRLIHKLNNFADEIIKLKSLISELLPYMLNDMTQGLTIGRPPFDINHCKDTKIMCPECQWFEDSTLWKKRVEAGEFQDFNI